MSACSDFKEGTRVLSTNISNRATGSSIARMAIVIPAELGGKPLPTWPRCNERLISKRYDRRLPRSTR